jgi:hypothetical protein
LPVAVLLPLLKKALVDVVWRGEASFSVVKTVLEIADVFLIRFFCIKFATFASIEELSFELDLVVVGEFHPEAVLESVQKLSVVDSMIVEIEEALVGFIFGDGVSVVDAIFELFDGGRANDHAAAEAQVGEEGKYL